MANKEQALIPNHLLSEIEKCTVLSRAHLQSPVTWQNDITALNEYNLNTLSKGIGDIQREAIRSENQVKSILNKLAQNITGWKDPNGPFSSAIFNDLTNTAISNYSTAFGSKTVAGAKGFYIRHIKEETTADSQGYINLRIFLSEIPLDVNIYNVTVDGYEKASDEFLMPTSPDLNKIWNLTDSLCICGYQGIFLSDITILEIGVYDILVKVNQTIYNSLFNDSQNVTSSDISLDKGWVLNLTKPTQGVVDIGLGAFAIGLESLALGRASLSAGQGTITYLPSQIALGTYNKLDDPELLFMLGNGEDDINRSNAFYVNRNGDTHVGKDLYATNTHFSKVNADEGVFKTEVSVGTGSNVIKLTKVKEALDQEIKDRENEDKKLLGTTTATWTSSKSIYGSYNTLKARCDALAGKDADTADSVSIVGAKKYTDAKISALINGAPDALDTLDELAAALNDDKNAYNALSALIDKKADKEHEHPDYQETLENILNKLTSIEERLDILEANAVVRSGLEDPNTLSLTGTKVGDVYVRYTLEEEDTPDDV